MTRQEIIFRLEAILEALNDSNDHDAYVIAKCLLRDLEEKHLQ